MNAFLIICHKNPNQVVRLAKRCKTDNTDVFVHADTSMAISDYAYLKEELDKIGAFVTSNRIHCELDHRSLVDATMILLQTAWNRAERTKSKYDYFALLSGQDYLIKPIKYIENQLVELYPQPLIDCTAYRNGNWVSKKFRKNSQLIKYRNCIEKKIKNKKSLRYCFFRGIGVIWRLLLQAARKSDYYYFREKGIELYGGSAWWILPDVVIDYINQEYQKNVEYINRLLETYTPEETFFQIMTKRTPFGNMVENNQTEGKIQHCKTFAYFSDVGKPFCGHPYQLTIDNAEMLSNLQDYWIARKFDESKDSAILDFIDERLLKEK